MKSESFQVFWTLQRAKESRITYTCSNSPLWEKHCSGVYLLKLNSFRKSLFWCTSAQIHPFEKITVLVYICWNSTLSENNCSGVQLLKLIPFRKLLPAPRCPKVVTFSPGLMMKEAFLRTGSSSLSYVRLTCRNTTLPLGGQDSSYTSFSVGTERKPMTHKTHWKLHLDTTTLKTTWLCVQFNTPPPFSFALWKRVSVTLSWTSCSRDVMQLEIGLKEWAAWD